MTFREYQNALRGRHITVVGIGVSNRPLLRMLVTAGAIVTACDQNTELDRNEWASLGITLRLGPRYLESLDGDIIFRTPGLRPDHPALARARATGSRITSEMEEFFALCPCPVYGVTGSDGKSTTTTLIAEMLSTEGYTVHLGGNLGTPLLTRCGDMRPEELCVVELSSFQLMDMTRSPQVAVITNLSPNHLDWHRDMDEYLNAKRNILNYQNPHGIAVLNADNDSTASLRGRGETRYFGGQLVSDGVIDGLLPLSDIRLHGWYNVENYMAAMTAVRGVVSAESIRSVARSFAGVAHRNQLVAERRGVRYFNNSIGSSPARTIATLLSHEKGRVLLIAGGRDKNTPFDELCAMMPGRVKELLLVGEAAELIEAAARRAAVPCPIHRCVDIPAAVTLASRLAVAGDTVLLSPACTSFDAYRNFEERGTHFAQCVLALPE